MSHRCAPCNRNFVNKDALQQHNSSKHKPSASRPETRQQRSGDTIDEFFAQYPQYPYNRNAPFWQEFRDMCDFFNWDRDNEEQNAAWKAFRIAVVQGFDTAFGKEENDIDAWGKLCETAGVSPIPEDLEGRRNVHL